MNGSYWIETTNCLITSVSSRPLLIMTEDPERYYPGGVYSTWLVEFYKSKE